MRVLAAYTWPGNVRELRSEVHRWAVFCDDTVMPGDLSPEIRAPAPPAAPGPRSTAASLADAVEAAERAAITAALATHAGNLQRTARALGIERNTLKRKLARYRIATRR
jgi:DNA-binding NtrC family response regulator